MSTLVFARAEARGSSRAIAGVKLFIRDMASMDGPEVGSNSIYVTAVTGEWLEHGEARTNGRK